MVFLKFLPLLCPVERVQPVHLAKYYTKDEKFNRKKGSEKQKESKILEAKISGQPGR